MIPLDTARFTPYAIDTMATSPGTLFLVGTPIGNMEDITMRALRVLREADLIAAEDTRHTGQLLARHQIRKPLVSYHEFNEARRTPELLQKLQEGQKIALVSDAGMPTLSDPGTRLIRAVLQAQKPPSCHPELVEGSLSSGSGREIPRQARNDKMQKPAAEIQPPIPIEVIPGPSAVTAALAISGLAAGPFLFHGFLPHKATQRRKVLSDLASLPCALVFFESPYRLQKSLADMREILGDRHAVIARELTKKFEEILRDTLGALLKSLENRRVKGEITLVIEGRTE